MKGTACWLRLRLPARTASTLALDVLAWQAAAAPTTATAAALGLLAELASAREGALALLEAAAEDRCLSLVTAVLRRSPASLEVREPALALLWELAHSGVEGGASRVAEAAAAEGVPTSLIPLLGEPTREGALQRLRQLRGEREVLAEILRAPIFTETDCGPL